MSDYEYEGQELDLFSRAQNWKNYWTSSVAPYIEGDVLEVGAGLGVNTPLLASSAVSSWICLEPDPALASRATKNLLANPGTAHCKVAVGTTESMLNEGRLFDCILYIDVLEHIRDDVQEVERASRLLKSGGHLIVLSPAHQWLYTPFDKAIGHCRRYSKSTLLACSPKGCKLEKLWYLDAAGMLASTGNRLFLQQSMPKLSQILFWDQYLVRASRLIDILFFHSIGKSVLAIWTRDQRSHPNSA